MAATVDTVSMACLYIGKPQQPLEIPVEVRNRGILWSLVGNRWSMCLSSCGQSLARNELPNAVHSTCGECRYAWSLMEILQDIGCSSISPQSSGSCIWCGLAFLPLHQYICTLMHWLKKWALRVEDISLLWCLCCWTRTLSFVTGVWGKAGALHDFTLEVSS